MDSFSKELYEELDDTSSKQGLIDLLSTTTEKDNAIIESSVRKLIDEGADVNAINIYGQTPLIITAHRRNISVGVAKMLVEAGADINYSDDKMETPLFVAAKRENIPVIEYLIEQKAIIDQPDLEDKTPLIIATLMGNTRTVEILIKNGANVNYPNYEGFTPLIFAIKNNKNGSKDAIIEMLIRAGANADEVPGLRKSAIEYAVKYDDFASQQLLNKDKKYLTKDIIDEEALPNEIPKKIQMDKCQKLKFSYKYNTKTREYAVMYYVPFESKYDLDRVIKKSIYQTELLDNTTVDVENAECDLKDCVEEANNINELAKYIEKIQIKCTECVNFVRGWECCGQFAPFIFVYHYLLYERKSVAIEQGDLKIPTQIHNIANVFYKLLTSYGSSEKKSIKIKKEISDKYAIKIANLQENSNCWFCKYQDKKKFQTDPLMIELENRKSHLIVLYSEDFMKTTISHYCFIYRCNDYVIMCDSWAHDSGKRLPVTRIINYKEFRSHIATINIIREMDDIDENMFSLYNFIMDSLFLIPYNDKSIETSEQSFQPRTLLSIVILDPDAIDGTFELLSRNTDIFNMYLKMGGKKKNKRTKRTKRALRRTKRVKH